MKVSILVVYALCFMFNILLSHAIYTDFGGVLKTLLDRTCATVFIEALDGHGISKVLLADDNLKVPGVLNMNVAELQMYQFDSMRSTWPCFDVVGAFTKPASKMANPIFEARNTRYIYVGISSNDSIRASAESSIRQDPKQRQQTILHLSSDGEQEVIMSLACPPDTFKATKPIQKINVYSKHKSAWFNRSHLERKLYKLCNPGGFYQGKSFTLTGIGGTVGTTSSSTSIVKKVAQALGAKYKFKRTRGCTRIVKRYPRPKNTLGLIYYNKADIGIDVMLHPSINKNFDYIYFMFEDYYFVGPKPEMLPQFQNLTYPFDNPTWCFTLGSLILYIVLAVYIQWRFKNGILIDAGVMIWGMLFSEHHFKIFVKKPISGVWIRMFWLIGVTLLTMAYQGTLKASLTKRTFEKDTETHWDMIQKDLPVYTYSLSGFGASRTADYTEALTAHVQEKKSLMKFQDMFKVLDRLFGGEKAFMITTYWQKSLFERYFRSKYGNADYPLARVHDRYSLTYLAYAVKKFTPQTEEIESIVEGFASGGIILHEYQKHDLYRSMKQTTNRKNQEKIALNHLFMVNIALLASYVMGIAVFVYEVIKQRKKMKQDKTSFLGSFIVPKKLPLIY